MSMPPEMQKGRDSGKSAPPTTRADDCGSSPLVHLRRGAPVTDSLTIGREFRRNHRDVLRTLDGLIADGTVGRRNFALTAYTDERRALLATYAAELRATTHRRIDA